MFDSIKQNLFTVTGIAVSVIHLFVVVGFVTCWVVFQVHVLGNDPMAAIQGSKTTSTTSARK